MHPILADRRRLALYLLAWGVLAVVVALLVIEPGQVSLRAAIAVAVPPTIAFAFICLSAWYPVRALPLRTTRVTVLTAAHLAAALAMGGGWLLMLRLWSNAMSAVVDSAAIESNATVFFVIGTLLYLLSVAVYYLLSEIEQARQIERREMQVMMLARETELKVLKAQVDPHFLFNSLNSINSLCGSNPSSARTLTTLLAEYLRKSLRLASAESITLSEELELLTGYIAIERIRFGARLELAQSIDESVRECQIPPLLLQPLIENAVTHGIGNLLAGGTITVTATREGNHVRLDIENPCDPDRPRRVGTGIGLTNSRRRIEVFYDRSARLDMNDEPERFRVSLILPA